MSTPDFTLHGKTALVTGAFGGLGLDFAQTLAEAGAAVALVGRRIEQGQQAAEALRSAGYQACAVTMDVGQRASVEQALDEITQQMGAPDILVNNAGIALTKPFLELDDEDWDSVIDVNLNGGFRVAQLVACRMQAAGKSGSIINIASILGLRVAQQVAAYATSKAGLLQLTRAMALELARYRIRVNALAPGYIATPLNEEFIRTEAGARLSQRIPQRRFGLARELAGPLLLLASDASSYMTGAVIVVDGGHSTNTL
ncbi:MAG: SDR family NAD(P)-dependent oxidoreductase [Pseudomonadota bacterium]